MSLRKTIPLAIATGLASTGSMTPTDATASQYRPLPGGSPQRPQPVPERAVSPSGSTKPGTARPLPYAHGRHFADLDAYLRYRREQSAIDLPWYEEVAPGLYALRTNLRPQPKTQRITRAELARKFGFDD